MSGEISRERWSEMKELFAAALEGAPDDRERLLEEAGRRDPSLAAEVRSLLAAHGGGELRVESAVAQEAMRMLAGSETGPRAGTRVGPYEIERPLGAGGMGAVFLGRRADAAYESRVAIKLIRPGLLAEETLARFRAERQTLASLSHASIARLLDGGTTAEGLPYLVMEYVEGVPIDVFCQKRTLPLSERLVLFRVVCGAVAHAHKNLVVHRDIKPGNILVSESGEVKLLDFGIAKLLKPEAGTDLTRTGERVLTPDYASPEQVRGGPITTATDIYSLGVLLYRLLTGRHPYRLPADRSSPSEIERIVCGEIPQRPSTAVSRMEDASTPASPGDSRERLRRLLRGDLDNIVLKALRKEPERRYGTVDEFSEDIRRHTAGIPVSARRETLPYLASRFFLRHKAAATAAILVAASLALGIVVATRQARLAQRERAHAQTEQAKAERIRDFLTGMLSSADPHWYSGARPAGPGVTVAEVLDDAAGRIEKELGGDPEVEAAVRRTLGRTYQALGRYDAAQPQLAKALALHRRIFPSPHAETAKSLTDLANLHLAKGDYANAEPLFREAVASARALSPRADEVLAEAVNNLGILLWQMGRGEEAAPMVAEGISIVRRLPGEKWAAAAPVALGNLGLIYDQRGDLDGAEARYRDAITAFEKRAGRPLPEKAWSLINLGSVMRLKGRLTEAQRLLEDSLTVWRETVGEDHPNAAQSRLHLALVANARGDSRAAEEEVERALAIFRRVLPPDHPDIAKALTVQGIVLTGSGRVREAETVLTRALALRRRLLPAGDWRIGETAGALGACLTGLGRFDEAGRLLAESHATLKGKMGGSHPRTQEAEARLRNLAGSRSPTGSTR